MVRKRNIDADLLKQAIMNMPVTTTMGNTTYYGNSHIEAALDQKIEAAVRASLELFKYALLDVVEQSAMLHSACGLCAVNENECQPPKPY